MLKKILFKSHIASLLIVCLHFLSERLFNAGLTQNVIYFIKITAIISGFAIAILYFKTLKNKRYYFGLYPIGIIIFLFGYVFRGFLGGLLMSVIQYPIISDTITFQQKPITIYTKYTGFLSRCCTYGVYETYYTFFEKKYGEFTIDGQSTLIVKNLKNTSEFIKLTVEDYVFDTSTNDMILQNRIIHFNK